MGGTDSSDDSIFRDISADDEQMPYEIESYCVNCHENGTTRLICVRIPYYRQVVVMSFSCDHCGYRNNELQSAEAVQEHGTEIVLQVKEPIDLNRQVVKSEYAQVEIPELELVIPSMSQPGEISTVEGVLDRTKSGLLQDQERRRELDPENAKKIEEFVAKLDDLLSLKRHFTFKLKDATGNCYIQNPAPFHVDPRCIITHYHRTLAENKMLSLADDNDEEVEPAPEWQSFEDAKHEVLRFNTECSNCGAPTETCMKPTDIPYFSTVIIMATSCDVCGLKTNEVKSAGAIRDRGCRLTCSIEEDVDLARDVLKSDTCSFAIPELELEVGGGALDARFTTIEGLLMATRDQIKEQNCFFFGDSATSTERQKMSEFFERFNAIIALKEKVHVVLDDPTGNSYIQSLSAPLEDPRLRKDFYQRSFEQNEELGLNDMKTENYGELEPVKEEEEESEEEQLACGDIPRN